MTNLKTKNLNSKYYQSEIINIIRKENKKKAPSVKIISEFRSNPLTNRNSKIAGKYDTNYRTLNKTYEGLNTEITDKHINQENLTKGNGIIFNSKLFILLVDSFCLSKL